MTEHRVQTDLGCREVSASPSGNLDVEAYQTEEDDTIYLPYEKKIELHFMYANNTQYLMTIDFGHKTRWRDRNKERLKKKKRKEKSRVPYEESLVLSYFNLCST